VTKTILIGLFISLVGLFSAIAPAAAGPREKPALSLRVVAKLPATARDFDKHSEAYDGISRLKPVLRADSLQYTLVFKDMLWRGDRYVGTRDVLVYWQSLKNQRLCLITVQHEEDSTGWDEPEIITRRCDGAGLRHIINLAGESDQDVFDYVVQRASVHLDRVTTLSKSRK
jgi:hypothetical protein